MAPIPLCSLNTCFSVRCLDITWKALGWGWMVEQNIRILPCKERMDNKAETYYQKGEVGLKSENESFA